MPLGRPRNQVGLKLNGTHQLLAYADDVNLLGDNTYNIKKTTENLIGASREVEATKYMLLAYHQNVNQNYDIKIADRSFDNVAQSIYLGMGVTNQNFIQTKTFCLPVYCQKMRIYETIILPVVLYGHETWSLTLKEEHRLRVIANRVLRRIFGLKRDEVLGGLRKLLNEEFYDLYSLLSIIKVVMSGRMKWTGHVGLMGEKRNAYTLMLGWPELMRPLGRPRHRWVGNIKMDFGDTIWGGGY
jgi:hypothetical protein